MVEKFKDLTSKIISEKGPVTMFAILRMDDLTDKWTVILSAPWVTDEKHKELFEYLRSLISSSLSQEERATVARIGVFSENEHLVESLLQYKVGSIISGDVKVNGNVIHEGYILASNGRAAN